MPVHIRDSHWPREGGRENEKISEKHGPDALTNLKKRLENHDHPLHVSNKSRRIRSVRSVCPCFRRDWVRTRSCIIDLERACDHSTAEIRLHSFPRIPLMLVNLKE